MTTKNIHSGKRSLAKLAAVAVLGISSALASSANAAIQYSISNVVPSGTSSIGYDINNNGDVLGGYYNSSPAPLFNGYDFSAALGNPVNGTYIGGLNDSGLVAGYFYDASIVSHSFIYSSASNTAQDLISAFPAGTTQNLAYDINNSGTVVGYFYKSQWRAFRYSGGIVTDLTSLFPVGTSYSRVEAINNTGSIIGLYAISGVYHAYLYAGGTLTDLNPALGNSSNNYPSDINNSNQVVGQFYNGTANHAFLYSNGNVTDIGNTLLAGATKSSASAINDSGQVVGYFRLLNSGATHAFLYSNGVGRDLNDLIDPASGWVLEYAEGINNKGQITGSGTLNGEYRAFVLSLRSIYGSGNIGSGSNRGFFYFGATSTSNSPGVVGTFSYNRQGLPAIVNAPITSLTYSGNTATFSGTFSRGKSYANDTFVVTIDDAAQTFSLKAYHPFQANPFYTHSGNVTSGSVDIT